MNLTINIKAYFNLLVIVYLFIFINFLSTKAISVEDDPENIMIDADKIIILDNGNEIQASGNIKIKTKNLDSTSDNSTYNKELNKIISTGKIIIKDKLNIITLKSKMSSLTVEKVETLENLNVTLLTSYQKLVSGINLWEQNYVFKAPVKGKLEYLKFLTNNQFVNQGEARCDQTCPFGIKHKT